MKVFDFSGYATKNNLKCSDGRVIAKDAFKHNDGKEVPLVWNHQHDDPTNVLGHAILENRDDGVYAYCVFNDTKAGDIAKSLVKHGDVTALSIWANQLKQNGAKVVHGAIKEVSLVLAGANPGAFIDSVLCHGDGYDTEEAIIYTGENIALSHADKKKTEDQDDSDDGETIADVIDTFNEKQLNVMYALIGQALEDSLPEEESDTTGSNNDEKGEKGMKHNVFDKDNNGGKDTLCHAEMTAAIGDMKRYGSLRDSVIAHGITNVEYLFPDAQTATTSPMFIQRDTNWVQKFMQGVHRTPFSRIKSILADITADEARAKGYIKGNLKTDQVFTLLKRTTSPTTVYLHQKFDRDDVVDIQDFDAVAAVKTEMRGLLDEEIARDVLVGDGRLGSSDNKVNETNIRPIWTDDDLYTIKAVIGVAADTTPEQRAKAFIRSAIKSRKLYKGSGSPTLWASDDIIADCLLIEDSTGRMIYDSIDKLSTVLRVKEIVAVPVMEGLTRSVEGKTRTLMGIMVNLSDYNIGADKGGAVNMFDDFDIDHNQQKYLIETRCSGALIKPYSAIAFELDFQ